MAGQRAEPGTACLAYLAAKHVYDFTGLPIALTAYAATMDSPGTRSPWQRVVRSGGGSETDFLELERRRQLCSPSPAMSPATGTGWGTARSAAPPPRMDYRQLELRCVRV